ncbi:MAG: Zn-ribbon domain-containing OB-fold protein [Dehalococcoidia bacterium]|nr:Zn-ribbon domain-containing OB-fold protein [Dehalococcoidia bacterium]
MTGETKKQEYHSIMGKMAIPYHNWAGALASDFLIALRDNKKITGTKCTKCNKVYVPPKSVCGYCFSKLDSLIEVGSTGILQTFTEVSYKEAMHPVEPPFLYGVVKLDGADTGLVHLIGGVKPEDIKIGMKLQAVFKDKREGSILDIMYFKPV